MFISVVRFIEMIILRNTHGKRENKKEIIPLFSQFAATLSAMNGDNPSDKIQAMTGTADIVTVS